MQDSTKSVPQVSLRKKIVALLLAVVMVAGLSFMALPATAAYAVSPTGNEHVDNPEGVYSCPQGGLFTFEGTGFVPNAGIEVYLTSLGMTLGSFDIDANGNIEPNGVYTDDRCTVIIPLNAPAQTTTLLFFYEGEAPATATFLNIDVTATQYQAQYSYAYWEDDELMIDINSTNSWGASRQIWIKIDYAEEPLAQTIQTNRNGAFATTVVLPDLTPGTSHVITLLAPPMSSTFPAISVSHTFTVPNP